jgi:hypothetical protein
MGQPITVATKPSSNPRVLRFEINRSLTGMSHERYSSLDDIVDTRAVDELARRLFEHGGVDGVHINSNVITVRLAGGSTGEGLDEVIGHLFRFYPDGPAAAEDTPATPPPTGEAAAPESTTDPASVTDEVVDDAPAPDGTTSTPSGQQLDSPDAH